MFSLTVKQCCCSVLLLALALFVPCSAKISSLSVTQDSRRLFAIESFGFQPGGMHQMIISKVGEQTENAGFLLVKQNPGAVEMIEESASDDSACLWKNRDKLEEKQAGYILTAFSLQNGVMGPFTVTEPGEARVYFVNCRNSMNPVSFDVEVTQHNPTASGIPDYLSAGEGPLDKIFGLSSLMWLCCACLWIKALLSNPEYTKAIHHLMTALVCIKFLSVFFHAIKFHIMKADGTAHGWTAVYYVFTFMKGILMFTVILLIGTGWSLFKPFLSERDKRIVAIVIPLQIMTNIAYVYVDENMRGSPGWLTWRDLLHLMDIACCCAILFPIVWSIKHLRDAAATDGKAQRNVERLRLFRQFYIMVVAYIYFTRIVVFLLGATLPFGYSWVDHFIYECATLAFFSLTGYRFQPVENNPYLMVDQDSDDEDNDLLQDEPDEERGNNTSARIQSPTASSGDRGTTIPLNKAAAERIASL